MQFFNEGRKSGTFEAGIQNAMVAMLASAKFLYRVEEPPAFTSATLLGEYRALSAPVPAAAS